MSDAGPRDDRVPVKADAVGRLLLSEIDRLRRIEAAGDDCVEFSRLISELAAALTSSQPTPAEPEKEKE